MTTSMISTDRFNSHAPPARALSVSLLPRDQSSWAAPTVRHSLSCASSVPRGRKPSLSGGDTTVRAEAAAWPT